ncbi:MAG: hypothetical protein BroJett029_26910 [Alphaproteobacteria bacterium]|nr:MAG: hypothetical protein BroJett029_26910 [Alphaproteobacteria bacterium]
MAIEPASQLRWRVSIRVCLAEQPPGRGLRRASGGRRLGLLRELYELGQAGVHCALPAPLAIRCLSGSFRRLGPMRAGSVRDRASEVVLN